MSFGIPVRNGLAVGLLASTFLSSLRIGGRPAMFLNFIGTNSLDSRVTFTRATTATFVGSNGLIQTAAIDGPRFDYDPVTLAPKGLLIEEARTNLFVRSQEFDSASWPKSAVTVTANTAVSPDGTSNADVIIPTAVSTNHFLHQDVVVNGVNPVTFSVYVKASGYTTGVLKFEALSSPFNSVNLSFNLTAVTVTPTTYLGGVVLSSSITNVGNGWFRITVTATTGFSGNHRNYIYPNIAATFTGNGTSGILAWGAQVEVGAFATSYIPTVASTVLRNADLAAMTSTNFSSWYNQTEGTLVANFTFAVAQPNFGTLPRFIGASDQAGLTPTGGTAITGYQRVGGATQMQIALGSSQIGTFKAAMAYGTTSNTALSGAVGTSVAGSTAGSMTTLTLGIASHVFHNTTGQVWYRAVSYYNTRLPDVTLRALTT